MKRYWVYMSDARYHSVRADSVQEAIDAAVSRTDESTGYRGFCASDEIYTPPAEKIFGGDRDQLLVEEAS